MRKRVLAKGAVRPKFSAKLPASRPGNPRSCRAWCRDLQSGTAFAALFAIGLIGAVPAAHAQEPILPTGGTVTHGSATISGGGNSLLIDQTSGSAIISWDAFSIGTGGITHFNNGSGATLNRVTGNLPSTIDGSLTATGSLFLVNPAGVVVGIGGMVATGGTFAASTQDVSDADFLDGGDTVFAGDSKAQVVNHGTISSAMGDVALIARRVENTGDISAPNGTAALLAGYDVLMHETTGPNGKFVVRAGGSDTEVVNSGTINAAEVELRANGGNVLALAGNTKGVIKATGVAKRGGRIFLTAGGGKVQAGGRMSARRKVSSGSAQQAGGEVFINADTVLASGDIDVSGLGAAGGNIDIGGRDIALQGATLDASGTTGGGRIRVGGAYQGGDFGEATTAEKTTVDENSLLTASAIETGDGGEVIVWADDTTLFDGTIEAYGGTAGGRGGLVETSGKRHLGIGAGAYVGTAAADGSFGMWLLDPATLTVGAAEATAISASATDITLQADDLITVNNAIDNNNDITLSFIANDFDINAAVDVGANGTLMFDRASAGAIAIGIPDINAISGANIQISELGLLTAGSLIFGDPDSSQNNLTRITIYGTADLSTQITGLVQFNALYNEDAYITTAGTIDYTAHSLGFNANDGVEFTSSGTVTTTTGDVSFDVDADNTGVVAGFDNLQADDGAVVVNSAGNISIVGPQITEISTGTFSFNANGGAGAISIARSNSGEIGLGDGASGGLSISDALLGRMTASSLTIGDASNTTTINVDGIDIAGLGALTLNTTNAGTVNLTDSAENYTFASLAVNAGTANLGATINTTGAQTYDAAVDLAGDTTLTSTGGGAITFNDTIDGGFDLTVNSSGTTTFNDIIGGAAALGGLTTDAAGTTVFDITAGTQIEVQGDVLIGDDVTITGGNQIWDLRGTTTFDGTITSDTQMIFLAQDDLIFNDAVTFTELQIGSGGTVFINGGSVETTGNNLLQGIYNPVILGADAALTSNGVIRFGDTLDGAFNLTLNADGVTEFGDPVGGTTPLASLTTDAAGTTEVNGGLVATTGSQIYNDQVGVAGTVFASTAGSLNFNAGVTTTLPNNDVWFLAADDISFGGSAQWNGTGNMTLVAGWNAMTDGSTGWTLGDTTADTATIINGGFYGNDGDIFIGDGTQTAGISVGSSGGTTTALARDLNITGSTSADDFAQLGFRGAATGDIDVMLTRNLTAAAGGGARSYAQLGHGGYGNDNDHSGAITVDAGGNLAFTGGGSGFGAYAQLGHGGWDADGTHSGDIDIDADGNLTFAGGDGDAANAQLGHGGYHARGSHSGDIAIDVDGNLAFIGGSGGVTYAQLGHGGAQANGNHSGDIAVDAGGNLTFAGGSSAFNYAQLGHGGVVANFRHSGDIAINADGNLTITGGSADFAYAQIGHGDASFNASGDRMGDISAVIGGLTTLTANTADAWFGHATTIGDITDANVALVTNGLDTSGITNFADMLKDDVEGGNVLIANRLAADTGSTLDDLVFDGTNNFTVDSEFFLTLATGGELTMLRNYKNDGEGDINLVGGWDGVTGLDLNGFPALDVAAIEAGDAFGAAGGDVNIGDGTQNRSIEVGTRLGDVHVLAHDFEMKAGTTNFDYVQLGYDVGGPGEVDSNIRVVAFDDVFVDATNSTGATDTYAIIGHTTSEADENVGGDITIIADTAADNVVVVAGGNGEGSFAQIGHRTDAFVPIETSGNVSVQSEDIFVEGGSEFDAYAQIGHSSENGTISGTVSVTGLSLEVTGGDGEGAEAQIGHFGIDGVTGDIGVTITDDLFVTGGDDDFTAAYIGHSGEGDVAAAIDVNVGGSVLLSGGSDDNSEAQIGHSATDGTLSGNITVETGAFLALFGGSSEASYAQIGHGYFDSLFVGISGEISVDVGADLAVIGGFDNGAFAQIGHGGDFAISPLSGGVTVEAEGSVLLTGGFGDYAPARIGHGGYEHDGSRSGDISVTSNGASFLSLPVAGIGLFGTGGEGSHAQIGHGGINSIGDSSGAIEVSANGSGLFGQIGLFGGFEDGANAQIGHGGLGSEGTASGDISVNAGGDLTLAGGSDDDTYAQIGHGDNGLFSEGDRMGDITVLVEDETSIVDGTDSGSEGWIGHRTFDGTISDADVFIQAFGFDRSFPGTVAAGDLGDFNKDILAGDIVGGDFTLIATGTGLLLQDPVYNSPHDVLISVNNDLVLDTNAVFVNSGTGNIVLAAGGDFHNDTGSLTPITTGGRWLVYSTRPDNNRNDVEVTNWDFLRYATSFDINNPYVGSGDGFVYSVAPVVNFAVSSETIAYGGIISPTITQTLTVNGIQVDANAFGLGINPATAQYALASFVTLDASGNPIAGFYDDGLTTGSESIPYFGMSFTSTPGDLTVNEQPTVTVVDGNNPIPTATNAGIGGMCAFRSDDEDPDEDGPAYDRIIELCGIIESDRD